MTVLSVNLNKVALLRNQRDLEIPNVVRTGELCLDAGAHGLTLHPRPDGRHALPRDVLALRDLIAARAGARPGLELNVEGNPFPDFLALVKEARPHQCTLVPDSPDARTSDHGWDLARDGARLTDMVATLHDLGVRVSVFMDPDLEQIERVPATRADRIELYTEPYAKAWDTPERDRITERYRDAAARAQALGLGVNAGHDLNLANLAHFCRVVPDVLEVSIGHAITADALEMGWSAAVRAYVEVLRNAATAERRP